MSARRRAKPSEPPRRPVCAVVGKTRWPTEKAAKGSASHVRKHQGKGIRVYKCPHCRDWHLTSQPELSRDEQITRFKQQDRRNTVCSHAAATPPP